MIETGKTVKIHYTLIVDGNVLESSQESGPLEYEHGKGQIIPGLENALEGLNEGDSNQIEIGLMMHTARSIQNSSSKSPAVKSRTDSLKLERS